MSFAHGHAGAYAQVLPTVSGAELKAVWDDDPERGGGAAQQYGVEYNADLTQLLAREDIQAVIVTAQTNRHADLCVAAARAGKHILCQKPLATTLEDCDRIIAATEESGVHFEMAYQMRCDPLNQQLVNWVHGGHIGRPGLVRRRHCINFLFNESLPRSPSAWHIDPVQNVGMFFDDAVHAADFLYWLLGPPVSVMAEIDNVLTRIAPDDTGVAIYRWASGTMGVLVNSSVTLAAENTTEVYGDRGVIVQNWDDAVSVGHAPPGAPALKMFRADTGAWEHFTYTLPSAHWERLQAVPGMWLERVQRGLPPLCGARDGRMGVAMCLAAYQSAREGRRVLLNELN